MVLNAMEMARTALATQIRDQKIGDPGEVMLRESPVGSATVRERVSQVIKGNALPHGRATVGPDP